MGGRSNSASTTSNVSSVETKQISTQVGTDALNFQDVAGSNINIMDGGITEKALDFTERQSGLAFQTIADTGRVAINAGADVAREGLNTAENLGGRAFDASESLGRSAIDAGAGLAGAGLDAAGLFQRQALESSGQALNVLTDFAGSVVQGAGFAISEAVQAGQATAGRAIDAATESSRGGAENISLTLIKFGTVAAALIAAFVIFRKG
jgi:hypothetical protein